MRILKLSGVLVLACAGLDAQTAGISGVVINSVSGQPISGVHLKFFTLNVGGAFTDVFGAMSGRDGRFSITGMPPATYLLLPERAGFVHMMTPQGAIPLPSVVLKAGESIADFRLELTPRAVIAVRVVDEYGDPVPYAMLEATPVEAGSPVAAAMFAQSRASTNLLGEARITGGPGKFNVKATPNLGPPGAEIRSDGSSDAAYGPSWYPSSASADRASVVETVAGGDTAIEIRLSRQRGITISGTVAGIPPGTTARVNFGSGPSADRISMSRVVGVGPEGEFNFPRLPQEYYRVVAMAGTGGGTNLQSEVVELKPDAPDKVTLHLTLRAGAEVRGTLEIAGDPPGQAREKRSVTLGTASADTDADGTFELGGIFPGRYMVSVRPMPENGYIKSVELDGVASSERETDFTRVAQGSRLKVTLGRDGGQLSGTLLDKDGQPLGNTVAIVILAPDREHVLPDQNGLVKDGGKYSLTGIKPGKYILFAIDAFRSGRSSSMDDLKKLAERAEEIEIKAGEKITKDLKVLLKEDADARGKK